MKKYFLLITLTFIASFAFMAIFPVQGMMDNMMNENSSAAQSDDGHTAREEAEGKEVWEKLQSKELKCEDLTDENFGALGEYFMGQMAGDSHESMNNMMIQMMGEEGERQAHIAMGKRMSSCEPNAPMPQNMMNNNMISMMMGGGDSSMMGSFSANPMGWFGWGFGWIFMILFWVLVIVGIAVLVKLIINPANGKIKNNKSVLDILKERYAAGEIDKKEFEEIKKDLL